MPRLIDALQSSGDLLDLEVEELAAILLPLLPEEGRASFCLPQLMEELFPVQGGGLPCADRSSVEVALAEAIGWLQSQSLIIRDPGQPSQWYQLTRRGRKVRTGPEFALYRRGQALPVNLLQERLLIKVRHLFLRGDHDTAVFQAFKEVEVAVRTACGWDDDVLGVTLMRRAFHPETGPLTDTTKVPAEREAELALFAGAVGHAKNPASHRNMGLRPETASRLIVFASHLLDIVEARALLL
jgi:uncharacterized protein (TIGR02391 family)